MQKIYFAKFGLCGWLLWTAGLVEVAQAGGSPADSEVDPVSQSPLQIGGGDPPGNLVLTPSVEFPTVVSVANIASSYSSSVEFSGYFDPGKCYSYKYDVGGGGVGSYFVPVGLASGHQCSGLWSGNYLNWATTQTIDTFRSVLTGGDRFIDTPSLTVLQKARNFVGVSNFPDRSINAITAGGATPLSGKTLYTRVSNAAADPRVSDPKTDRRMLFSQSGSYSADSAAIDYQSDTPIDPTKTYRVYIRVQVCASESLLESNCKKYGSNYKPEGLLQKYSERLRFSVFSYLNDKYPKMSGDMKNIKRDGGVLRARQKFVGPVLDTGEINPNSEWRSDTGVFVENPSQADAIDTAKVSGTIPSRSGVINYINKFGETGPKTFDNVSELYYAAVRYLKNQGNVPEWSASPNDAEIDNFPVITSWDDPIKYSCQKNSILGIGDVNTHADKNLPGGKPNGAYEPTMPPLVTADKTVDAEKSTRQVGILEGVNTLFEHDYGGSLYIAGLAYDSHVTDIRPDMPGKQTISTYWVDVQEKSALTGRARNQYWLAAKYGGFNVPKGESLGDPYTRTTALPESWWHATTDVLSNGDKRPDNFFTGGDPATMRDSLQKAFAQIAEAGDTGTGNLSFESGRVSSGSGVFVSRVTPKHWGGDLLMLTLSGGVGSYGSSITWSAAAKLDALAESQLTSRNIISVRPTSGSGLAKTGINFSWSELTDTQKAALSPLPSDRQSVLDYLRGSRLQEQTDSDKDRPFRQRDSRLGDIINSAPAYSWHDPEPYESLPEPIGSKYQEFLDSSVYQNRVPLVAVGANDGMLHGFNASGSGGNELFAYVPGSLFGQLGELANPTYTHRYFVDGSPVIGNAWDGSDWKTLLVGATGAGGKSVFALDVTNPSSVTKSSVLWEFSDPNLGYTLGKPVLTPLPSGKFVVVVTSGAHNTDQDNGYVWILDAVSGSTLKTITLRAAGDLIGATAISSSGRTGANRLYVSDSKGALWRIDLLGDAAENSEIPPSLQNGPLFRAKLADGDYQPIVAPATATLNRKGEVMVLFGTGRYYRTGDNELPSPPEQPQVQSLYAIYDTATPIVGRGSLLEQKIVSTGLTKAPLEADDKGWYIDLPQNGTLALGKPQVIPYQAAVFNLLSPGTDPCSQSSVTYGSIGADLYTGGGLNYSLFDSDGDGTADTSVLLGQPTSGQYIRLDENGGESASACGLGADGKSLDCVEITLPGVAGRKAWQEER